MDENTQSDPSDGSGGEEDMSQGYVIELTVKPDGTMTIAVEAAQEEASEEAGASGSESDSEEPDDDAQPVKSLGEAISLIKDIVRNQGQMTDAGAADDQMNQGFSGKAAPAASSGGM